jgi:hypothetical protein
VASTFTTKAYSFPALPELKDVLEKTNLREVYGRVDAVINLARRSDQLENLASIQPEKPKPSTDAKKSDEEQEEEFTDI